MLPQKPGTFQLRAVAQGSCGTLYDWGPGIVKEVSTEDLPKL